MVVHTSGFARKSTPRPAMRFIAVERSILGIPNAVWMWAAIGGWTVLLLRRTTFGRRVYGIGNSERAVFLSRETSIASWSPVFAIAGACAAFAGVPLGGLFHQGVSSDGRSISLAGDRGGRAGGHEHSSAAAEAILEPSPAVVLVTLLQSILSIVQVPEAARQIIYGASSSSCCSSTAAARRW